ncbi:3'(2'),5'-bisphosphate nucleotidase CysQ [Pontivivens nitratireducens]|uniref:3'(2'),5'-bisphosphate nucleotidase CysQ n=1 Tax=Pontivivens nitratireducens TaxID=2758038 RepID=UPI00163ADCAA|nr:3'(2'),5'-bisphosphate nucleotidase CysQ [Pontibrevibacter nitratireducens]
MPEHEADRTLLIEAARDAAQVALRHFGASPQVWQKSGGQGPVSAADLEVDQLLREGLMTARPDYGWLSEETADAPDRLRRKRCFVVDPIDGTVSFLKGKPGWAISLAVVENGTPVAAVVAMPVTGHVYSATRGRGAIWNEQPMTLTRAANLPRISIPKNQLAAEFWPAGPAQITPVHGGALALRLTRLAEGDVDGTVTFRPVWEWDIAAGALIAAEAGARVSDRAGLDLSFNSPSAQLNGLIAAAPDLHADLMTRTART